MKNNIIRKRGKRASIKESILAMIRREHLKPGDQILSQNALAELLSTTPVTVHKALTEMAEEGLVERKMGKGTFVKSIEAIISKPLEIALVLPRSGLESPSNNPEHWPYVQDLIFAFTSAINEFESFHVCPIDPQADMATVINRLAQNDITFFHSAKELSIDLIKQVIASRTTQVIKLGMPHPDLNCLTIDHDRAGGARNGVIHLIQRGYRRIGFIGTAQWWGELSCAGYQSALDVFNLTNDASLIKRVGNNDWENARAALMLTQGDNPCDALFIDSDIRALAVIDTLRQNGISVPEDVGIISYDGLRHCTQNPPYLTSVSVPFSSLIRKAIDITESMGSKPAPQQHFTMIGEVLPGSTTTRRTIKDTIKPMADPVEA